MLIQHCTRGHVTPFLNSPALTDTLVGELVETRIDPHTRFITGGFGHAQQGDVFSWLLYYWSGATFRQRAETLHAACATMGLNSTLDSAAQAVLATPTLMHLVDQPLDALNAKDRDTLSNEMRGLLLQRELRRCLDTLAEVALRPLATWLRRAGRDKPDTDFLVAGSLSSRSLPLRLPMGLR